MASDILAAVADRKVNQRKLAEMFRDALKTGRATNAYCKAFADAMRWHRSERALESVIKLAWKLWEGEKNGR